MLKTFWLSLVCTFWLDKGLKINSAVIARRTHVVYWLTIWVLIAVHNGVISCAVPWRAHTPPPARCISSTCRTLLTVTNRSALGKVWQTVPRLMLAARDCFVVFTCFISFITAFAVIIDLYPSQAYNFERWHYHRGPSMNGSCYCSAVKPIRGLHLHCYAICDDAHAYKESETSLTLCRGGYIRVCVLLL